MRIYVAIAVLAASVPASAQSRSEPVVLAVDGADLYVDLGARDGVGAGAQLELLHEIVAKDPATGKTLHDRFALGTLTVSKSGDGLSVAHADAELAKRVLVGDHVRLVSAKKTFVDPWEEQVEASRANAPQVPVKGQLAVDHATLAREAWQATLGKAPEQRIARWQELEAADPKTPYRKAIDAEIKSLERQIVDRDQALAAARSTTDDRAPRVSQLAAELDREVAESHPMVPHEVGVIQVAAIDRAVPGRPIGLAFLVAVPSKVGRAFLYVRAHGDPGFHRSELVRDGDAYMRGTIDGALVRDPSVDWYVEVVPPSARGVEGDEDAEPVIGSQQVPRSIAIDEDVTEPPPAEGRSHVDVHLDYVDFDGGLSQGYDQYYQAEADFMYRFLDPIYSVRLGFGTLTGLGGPKQIIDASDTCTNTDPNNGALGYRCKRVTFSYVYSEYEIRIRKNVALMLRPQIGVLTTDVMPGESATRCQSRDVSGCQFLTGIGGRVKLRLGEEQATNLVLAAGFSRGVGTLLEAAYHWLPAPVVPIQISVQVTDQPVIEDFGVRLIGDVGYKRLGWFYPSVRVSYQARSLVHTGVSGGMALNFDW
jgi:hypothetical protein